MRTFEHAAAQRRVAEAVLLRLRLNDGRTSWGEALPRAYVTGETLDSVFRDLGEHLWPAVVDRMAGRGGALRLADLGDLPRSRPDGTCMNAAACGLETALLAWAADLPKGGRISARVSGVVGSSDPDRTARKLRGMLLFGLRDIKLKLGFGEETDEANLQAVTGRLRRGLQSGKCTLRVDVNGGWDAATTPQRTRDLRRAGVCAVEQPVYAPAEQLADLAGGCALPLIADESLLTPTDADTLARAGDRVWWNVRIAKCGGVTRALALARRARVEGIPLIAGCMVGESMLLSAAQRLLLQMGPQPRFVEGNYGTFLLKADWRWRSLRMGLGGRLRAIDAARVLRRGPAPGRLATYAEPIRTLGADRREAPR